MYRGSENYEMISLSYVRSCLGYTTNAEGMVESYNSHKKRKNKKLAENEIVRV